MSIRLYICDVSSFTDNGLFEKLYSALNESEKEKVDRIRPQKEKMLSLGARSLLRHALKEQGLDPDAVSILTGEHGKPYVKDNPFFFSISHSGDKVIVAVSDKEIGCDIELVSDYNPKISERFFTPEENSFIDSRADKSAAFYRVWTLKESFMKATGLGFSLSLSDFSVNIDGENISVLQNIDGNSYSFREINCFDGYACSLCIKEKNCPEPEIITKCF